jgi:hypothetical protein
MQKRSSIKLSTDTNVLAKSIVDTVTGNPITETPIPIKNQAAVALGRLGGLKGGKARAEKLSPKKRKAIAQKAANARWAKNNSHNGKS